ncbi:hypothetical protein AGABI2DRAFT_116646 [Agaricus bisporus var. bisporus H97]|uniref:hypothetical protein n=1 Tax=Agaricus bisporus var. bisporus (strain H97 / ATCC MYA-4626 / FGSC 10389) TaxID=936046 RepID=UPI00029F6C27|nr:hypothetical protein AGABI2DRAFT_116646 [Agaricus bisporus var. bisporus H97]EKV49614.1 hypothetical protein AGABI2DRAFT_116646 [Agaricus bisporus var. bisporus H97]
MPGSENIHIELDVLNPDVYLNHIPQLEAQQIEIGRNIVVAVLGATIWDILVYIPDDIRIVQRSSRFSFVTFCYFFSRISAVVHALLGTMERAIPIYHLYPYVIFSSCLLSLSAISSSYIFLRRAQAIYAERKGPQKFFFISWLFVFGAGCLIPLGVHPSYIPGTYYYRYPGLATYVIAAPLVLLLFDTLVFIAISYKIYKEHSMDVDSMEEQRTTRSWIRLLSGRRLPLISKAVLRGGQQYYS